MNSLYQQLFKGMHTTSDLNMAMTQKYTSLSWATINRHREIGDFPQVVQLTGNRIGFYISELDE